MKRALCFLVACLSGMAMAVFPDHAATYTSFKSVGMIGNSRDGKFVMNGSGVAISPHWVIGVAHVGGSVFVQEGVSYPIERKIIHSSSAVEQADLALYYLSKPAKYVAPVLLKPFDGPAGSLRLKGRTAFLVGWGRTGAPKADGLGWSIRSGSEGVRRVAENRIDHTDSMRHNIGNETTPRWKTQTCLIFDLDKPGNPSLSTLGSQISSREGGVAAKDSGGAWFVNVDNQYRLVAISVGAGVPEGYDRITNQYAYGAWGFGVHLQGYQPWIYNTTGLAAFAPPPAARRKRSMTGLALFALALANAGAFAAFRLDRKDGDSGCA